MRTGPVADATNALIAYLREHFTVITMSNLMEAVVASMELAQEMKDLEGEQKKDVVIGGICEFLDERDLFGPLESVMLNLVPVAIDNLVAADRQRLKLHPQVTKGFWSASTWCCRWMTSKPCKKTK